MKQNHSIAGWLKSATSTLQLAGIGTARLDALVLLEDVMVHDRAWLLANSESEIAPSQVRKLTNLLKRRSQHEPLAYIRGRTEFYGREFLITSDVLEPRPESETMIDLLKALPGLPAIPYVSDVGAGSGALGITAALELPGCQVELLEIDEQALKVAKMNVDKFTLNIEAVKSDLLSGSKYNSNVLLCNLPYVPDDFRINTAARHEPRLAIFGGSDGLDLYRKLFQQVKRLSVQPLYILTEALPPQHDQLAPVAKQVGYDLQTTADFIQVFRPHKI